MTLIGNPVVSVFFNDGSETEGGANTFAIVTQDNGGENYNLFCVPASGEQEIKNSVPHREPPYAEGDNGGDTWHESYLAE